MEGLVTISKAPFAQRTQFGRIHEFDEVPASDHGVRGSDGPRAEVKGHTGPLIGMSLRSELVPYLPYVDKASPPNHQRRRSLEASQLKRTPWFDFDELRRWIRTCDSWHKEHCGVTRPESSSPWHGPLWLIDVISRCLIPGEDDKKYVALSYVWGNAVGPESQLRLHRGNLAKLRSENFFKNNPVDAPVMPKLIADVMDVVARLGERYLWIDRYCIVQDDGPAMNSQIRAMNSIYAGAYVTLVAADSSATKGLYGIKGQSPSRPILDGSDNADAGLASLSKSFSDTVEDGVSHTEYTEFQDDADDSHNFQRELQDTSAIMLTRSSSEASYDSFVIGDGARQQKQDQKSNDRMTLEQQAYLLMHTPWYDRGWTFQEALFSRRKIVFQNNTVNWECHCCARFEGQEYTSPLRQCIRRPGFSTDGGFDMAPWPDLYRYARLAALFNRRQLSFPEDALNAFAGVLTSLSRTFQYGFISGLPQMFFHATLIWQPYRPITRRVPVKAKDPVLPSWSWVGWHGVLQYESWRSGYGFVKTLTTEQDLARTTYETHETIKWYRLDDGGGKHLIKSLANCTGEVAAAAEPKWRSEVKDGQTTWEHGDIPNTEFWYPVPLRDTIKAHVPPMYTRYISTTTRSACVRGIATFIDYKVSSCTCIDLSNDDEEWIGVLRHPSDLMVPKQFELIELSAGSVRYCEEEEADCFDEWSRPGYQDLVQDGEVYHFYNVMAIKREGGKASREAVGRVEKSKWESLNLTTVDIVLA